MAFPARTSRNFRSTWLMRSKYSLEGDRLNVIYTKEGKTKHINVLKLESNFCLYRKWTSCSDENCTLHTLLVFKDTR